MTGLAGALARVRRRLASLPLAGWGGVEAGFILSTGRTGTLRVAQVLDRVTSEMIVLHEPSPDLFDLGEAFARGALSPAGAARGLRRARQPLCNRVRREGAGAYIESNTNASYLPGPIREVFDGPRFVHVVRDGRAVVRSLYSKTNPSRRPGQDKALFMGHDDHRPRLAAVDFPDDPWSAGWLDMSRFGRICWHWAKKNALIREALGDADDFLVIRFEDVFDAEAGHPGFWRLVEFLELGRRLVRPEAEIHELLAERTNRPARYRLPPPEEWSAELRRSFDRIAGAEHRQYYPDDEV